MASIRESTELGRLACAADARGAVQRTRDLAWQAAFATVPSARAGRLRPADTQPALACPVSLVSRRNRRAATKGQTVLPELEWSWPTRFVFFTGTGGVGKTTIAAAGSLALADRGKRVLVVSTDPASNLDDVFAASIGSVPTAVPAADLLWAQNIDPEAAVAGYRERVVAPYRGAVPDEELRALEEQLAGQCTVEIAAFDEFARLLSDPESTASFDHVFFDTAPTGHTLRLLSLPSGVERLHRDEPGGCELPRPARGPGSETGAV